MWNTSAIKGHMEYLRLDERIMREEEKEFFLGSYKICGYYVIKIFIVINSYMWFLADAGYT